MAIRYDVGQAGAVRQSTKPGHGVILGSDSALDHDVVSKDGYSSDMMTVDG